VDVPRLLSPDFGRRWFLGLVETGVRRSPRAWAQLTLANRFLSSVLLPPVGRRPAVENPRPLSREPNSGPTMQPVAPRNCRPLLCAVALALSGCWAAPAANVQPKGEPRLIQAGIAVESVKNPAVVQAVDADTRTMVVRTAGDSATSTYQVSPKVTNFSRIKVGSKVQITVAEELTACRSRPAAE
jgi:hypothetical protein